MWRKKDARIMALAGRLGKVCWALSFSSGFLYVMKTPRFDECAGLTAFQAQGLGLDLV